MAVYNRRLLFSRGEWTGRMVKAIWRLPRYGADAKQGDKQQSHYPRLLVFFGG